MSFQYKILGQDYIGYTYTLEPGNGSGYGYYYGSIGTPTEIEEFLPVTVYTVPVGKETTVTSIFITNHDTVARTYDLAIVPNDEELSVKHHIRWDMQVDAESFDLITTKYTMSAGDRLIILPSTVDKFSITAFGVEK
jgi:hypothetical protein